MNRPGEGESGRRSEGTRETSTRLSFRDGSGVPFRPFTPRPERERVGTGRVLLVSSGFSTDRRPPLGSLLPTRRRRSSLVPSSSVGSVVRPTTSEARRVEDQRKSSFFLYRFLFGLRGRSVSWANQYRTRGFLDQ